MSQTNLSKEQGNDAVRTRTFWSPDREYLVTAYVMNGDITLMDDDGKIWQPTGDEIAHD